MSRLKKCWRHHRCCFIRIHSTLLKKLVYQYAHLYNLFLPDESFSHVTLGLGADECHGHLLKLMVGDFDLFLLENTNENLEYILTARKLKNDSE